MERKASVKLTLAFVVGVIIILSVITYKTLSDKKDDVKAAACMSLRDRAMGEAIAIKSVGGYLESLEQEKKHLESLYGSEGVAWEKYSVVRIDKAGKYYDEVTIKLISSGEVKSIYFDVTEPFSDLVDMIKQGRLES